jgi:hypothetical protein
MSTFSPFRPPDAALRPDSGEDGGWTSNRKGLRAIRIALFGYLGATLVLLMTLLPPGLAGETFEAINPFRAGITLVIVFSVIGLIAAIRDLFFREGCNRLLAFFGLLINLPPLLLFLFSL